VITSETVGSATSGSEGRIEYIKQTGFVTFVNSANVNVGLVPNYLNTGVVSIQDSTGNTESKVNVAKTGRRVSFIVNVGFPLLYSCSLKIKFPEEIKLQIGETVTMSYP
jgi:hypothetical protein